MSVADQYTGLMLGFDEFEKDIESIIKQVNGPEVMHEMLEAMAEPIIKEAKNILRKSTDGDQKLENEIVSEWDPSRPTELLIGWTNDGFYGRFLEDGYHHIGSLKFIKRPHIRPAYNSKIGEGVRAALNVFRTHKYYTK